MLTERAFFDDNIGNNTKTTKTKCKTKTNQPTNYDAVTNNDE